MQLFGTDLGRAATEAAVAGQQVLWNVDLGHPAKPTRLDRRRVGGGAETRVVERRVARDEIQQDPDAPAARLVDQPRQVVVGAVARGDVQIVRDVVPGVAER